MGMAKVRVGLVGDYDAGIRAHQAIPQALARAGAAVGAEVEARWIGSDAVDEAALAGVAGLWCVPGSPYQDMDGALRAIRWARERGVPFLGSCGGFQHAVIEYARNVVGLAEADHAESNPTAALPLVAPLACALVGARGVVRFVAGTRLAVIYGSDEAEEGYYCSYGLNPALQARIFDGRLRVAARDVDGQVRAVELDGQRFFFATLFQPELSALAERTHPLVTAFVRAARG
jgi:CTP synthase (UTP-ammonia lyase)